MNKELFSLAQAKSPKLPLEHIRAVVLTQAWAGAYTTILLADMGAEVIQIESLDRPDNWRGGYPPRISGTYPGNQPGDWPYNRAASFNSVNTNKFGITLDLNTIEGKNLFLDLVSISDIVAENFSARVILVLQFPFAMLSLAISHTAEIESQGDEALLYQSKRHGDHHVIVHVPAIQRTRMANHDTGSRAGHVIGLGHHGFELKAVGFEIYSGLTHVSNPPESFSLLCSALRVRALLRRPTAIYHKDAP